MAPGSGGHHWKACIGIYTVADPAQGAEDAEANPTQLLAHRRHMRTEMPGVLWGGGGGWGEDRREGEGATPRIGVGTQHRGCPSACIEDMGLWEWQVCVHCPNAPPLKCILHPRVIVKVKLEPPLGSAGFPPTFSTVPQRPGPLNLAPPNPVILTSSPLPKPRLLGSFIRTFGRQEPSLLSLQFSS